MRRDFSWERSAQEYLTLYQELSDAKEEGSEKRPVEV
jgi:glycogen synthase